MSREHRIAADLSGSDSAARYARHLLRELLSAAPRGFVADAILMTSELVSNATMHTVSGCRLSAEFRHRSASDDETITLRVEVSDRSLRLPVLGDPGSHPLSGGRGLRLVDLLSDRWGAALDADGKVVWFEISASSSRSRRSPDGDRPDRGDRSEH